ncbi:MAG: CheR family methyltransferase [bacterium]
MHVSSQMLNNFQDLIYRKSSLRLPLSRLKSLEGQILKRIKSRALSSCEEYILLLQRDFGELDALIGNITTKETHFFRLPNQFKALAEYVIPRIEDRLSKETQKLIMEEGWSGNYKLPFRIWSAGCSTGEEPYSIAMILMDTLKYPRAWEIELLATDISKDAIDSASEGFYEKRILKNIPVSYQKKYMRMVSNGAIILNELSERISFRIFNLSNLNPIKSNKNIFIKLNYNQEGRDIFEYFDIIFCRNVMIYFDFLAQQKLVDNLYACIKPGGYLFTGDTEFLRIYKHSFETLELRGAYFYQKPDIKKTAGERREDE